MKLYKIRISVDSSRFTAIDPTWRTYDLEEEIRQYMYTLPFYVEFDSDNLIFLEYTRLNLRMFREEDLLTVKLKYGKDIRIVEALYEKEKIRFIDPKVLI